jgi:hypothetical protein
VFWHDRASNDEGFIIASIPLTLWISNTFIMFMKLLIVLVMAAFVGFIWWADKTERAKRKDSQ